MSNPVIRATAAGFSAILMWALLALLTKASGPVPPFQLVAMSFAIGAAPGLLLLALRRDGQALRHGWRAYGLGIGGLFFYHFFYFTALRLAPVVEASLIAYLWPLLIVLFSALLPGERLAPRHVLGAMLGFAGAVLIISGGKGFSVQWSHVPGYLAAVACALIWSAYSVLSRRLAHVPSMTVSVFCALSALLALVAHLVLENTVWPQGAGQWLAVAGLGLGPVGLAFHTWDHGVKHGSIRLLGVGAYAAPLLSTFVLMVAGQAQPGFSIIVACLLIVAGAFLAGRGNRGSSGQIMDDPPSI